VDRTKRYPLARRVQTVARDQGTKFDESVDIAVRLGSIQARGVRWSVALCSSHGTGKTLKVAVVAKGDKAKEAQDAVADFVVPRIWSRDSDGKLDRFDSMVAPPT